MNHASGPAVVLPPRSRRAMLNGVDTLVSAIQPTLGPLPRAVAVAPLPGSTRPIELLDDGGLIARRLVALPDRDADAGAMLARQVIWRVHERAGDGSATAAVLFRAVFAGSVRAVEAGADPGRLRATLEAGARVIVRDLAAASSPLAGEAGLVEVARALCGDAALGAVLGQALATVGADGEVEIRPALDGGIDLQYVDGAYWESGLLAREMSSAAAAGRVHLHDAAIVISDLDVVEPRHLAVAVDRARDAGARSLVVVAQRLSERSLGFLLARHGPPDGFAPGGAANGTTAFPAIAVRTPGTTPEAQYAALEELALLCGGRPLLAGAGQAFDSLSGVDFGRAQRVWATHRHFGIVGGGGDPMDVQARIGTLRRAAEGATTAEAREDLRRRMSRLLARRAVISVGGATDRDGQQRRERARRTSLVLREALRHGVVPGGGAALLACRNRLAHLRDDARSPDERTAWAILAAAAEAPFRAIVANAGHDPERALHGVSVARPGHGFDVVRGEVVDMLQAGIVDATRVQQAAVDAAVKTAALACTIGVLVHPSRREESVLP